MTITEIAKLFFIGISLFSVVEISIEIPLRLPYKLGLSYSARRPITSVWIGFSTLAREDTILTVMFTDLFDSISTFIGVAEACGLKDEHGDPKNLKEGLIVDAFATLAAGLFGSSSGTAYIESSAGIELDCRCTHVPNGPFSRAG